MSWMALGYRFIYATGLRKIRGGRRLVEFLSAVANCGARMWYLPDRRPVDVNGHKLLLGSRNLPTFAFLSNFLHHRYEVETFRVLSNLIRSGMTVFDVGAHVGHYTLLAARKVGSTG